MNNNDTNSLSSAASAQHNNDGYVANPVRLSPLNLSTVAPILLTTVPGCLCQIFAGESNSTMTVPAPQTNQSGSHSALASPQSSAAVEPQSQLQSSIVPVTSSENDDLQSTVFQLSEILLDYCEISQAYDFKSLEDVRLEIFQFIRENTGLQNFPEAAPALRKIFKEEVINEFTGNVENRSSSHNGCIFCLLGSFEQRNDNKHKPMGEMDAIKVAQNILSRSKVLASELQKEKAAKEQENRFTI